ncbi:uncharacterized protein ASCRUDRAFT_80329 [Ascoidea rubescens DSM 1968]|uniref:Outer arm dynein light chain 1 n=1 Tax=Ascoidea rubescens DSM 1968 TaxID=1344418 RepID=A0A1D2VK83_9ASCO|nr:hypothetical protein ASCRUDRAFT_80329 [Ascoidea rubescens DSM 1968]ODV61995.1 hypothetical protein ASCRUDRAFT_80329 [Ascoidea rubescens DSM 1968]
MEYNSIKNFAWLKYTSPNIKRVYLSNNLINSVEKLDNLKQLEILDSSHNRLGAQ